MSVKEAQDLLTYFLEYVLANMTVPGVIENWILIADMNGLNVATVPYGVESVPYSLDVQRDFCFHAE